MRSIWCGIFCILLARKDLEFDGVIATDDGLAVGAVKYARAKKLSVPQDISIIGYNNSELSIGCEPELSSIDSRGDLLCKMTIDSLMEVLKGESMEHRKYVQCRLEKRCTTDF